MGRTQKYLDEDLLQILVDFHRENGRPPLVTEMGARRGSERLPGMPNLNTYLRRFGTFQRACALAQIPHRDGRGGLESAEIVELGRLRVENRDLRAKLALLTSHLKEEDPVCTCPSAMALFTDFSMPENHLDGCPWGEYHLERK
jgi:hypothetical protein